MTSPGRTVVVHGANIRLVEKKIAALNHPSSFDAVDLKPSALMDEVSTPSFFSEERNFVLRRCEQWKISDWKLLRQRMEETSLLDGILLVFCVEQDSALSAAMKSFIKSSGAKTVSCLLPKKNMDQRALIQQIAAERKRKISSDALQWFLERTNKNPLQTEHEFEKIDLLLPPGKMIQAEDLEDSAIQTVEVGIFDFLREVEVGNRKKAVRILWRFMKQKPIFLMALGGLRGQMERYLKFQCSTGKPLPMWLQKKMTSWSHQFPLAKTRVYYQKLCRLDGILKSKPPAVQSAETLRLLLQFVGR